jgi:hypothetical protein
MEFVFRLVLFAFSKPQRKFKAGMEKILVKVEKLSSPYSLASWQDT